MLTCYQSLIQEKIYQIILLQILFMNLQFFNPKLISSTTNCSFSMTPFLFISIALPIITIYLLLKTLKPPLPPGPPRLPLIGNLHQFLASGNVPIYLWKLSEKYGPVIHLKLGSIPLIVISSAKLAKEALKTQDLAFCSRPKLLGQQKLSYRSMDMAFAPYGEYWREMRKITSIHLLSLKKIQSFRHIREEEISRVIAEISRVSEIGEENSVNLSEMSIALGSTLICRIAFGRKCDEQESKVRRYDELLREAQAVLATFFVSDYFPSLSWMDKLNGHGKWLEKTYADLDSFYEELIDEHLDPKMETKEEQEKDIIDVLIELKEDKSCSIDLSWQNIKALLMNIFIGATDTSAATTVWMMTALMKEPKIMNKLQTEIRNRVGPKGKVDEDDLPKFTYLKAVMNETFRLHAPIPLLVPRETIASCTLEGYQIQPKTLVYVNAWAIGRDPEFWENPEEFRPERFLDSGIDARGQDFGLIPFGSGRRMCPGAPMGLVNVELTVANLLYSFDWAMPRGIRAEDIDEDAHPGITMHKKQPLILVPKEYIPN